MRIARKNFKSFLAKTAKIAKKDLKKIPCVLLRSLREKIFKADEGGALFKFVKICGSKKI